MAERMLEIRGLKIHFGTEEGLLRAVDGVDLAIDAGETLGVVGESGCGKSVTALTVMRLLPMPPARIAGGEIRWRGRDLVAAGEEAVRELRAREIAMIFQEPMTSLNPVYTVGEQIAEEHDDLLSALRSDDDKHLMRVVERHIAVRAPRESDD